MRFDFSCACYYSMMRSGNSSREWLPCVVLAVLSSHLGHRSPCIPWRAVRALWQEGSQQQRLQQRRADIPFWIDKAHRRCITGSEVHQESRSITCIICFGIAVFVICHAQLRLQATTACTLVPSCRAKSCISVTVEVVLSTAGFLRSVAPQCNWTWAPV